ncbi:helix-turn-helix domain-containing protein [Pelosinus propionicus]|uniref:DNA binding domain-containing protein, excisionase family n=1 Tax=Pelosinus propionicus DSM 13327 TaxID=1123291 RepID=A0A1I4JH06_9FIRM|nr:helix-turn-helix domain-containing protein [Pelosinus propionicus]SFL65855.1 DNA binding domain-containing protein, excisionase family [Pelosinus propionicus DSM 13327]
MPIKSPFLNVKETAEYLNIPLSRAAWAVGGIKFPAIQFGSHWRIHKEKLDEWVKENPEFLAELRAPLRGREQHGD